VRFSRMLVVVALAFCGGMAAIAVVATRPLPTSLELTGYAGSLAEWSVTATLTSHASRREFVGIWTMEHSGMCSIAGPEQKTADIRLRMARWSSRVDMSVRIDDGECHYSGYLSDTHSSALACPGSPPLPVTLWSK
jgi:hypothetical protein